MWEPRRITTLCASTACYRDGFTFTALPQMCPYLDGVTYIILAGRKSLNVANIVWATFVTFSFIPALQIRCHFRSINVRLSKPTYSRGKELRMSTGKFSRLISLAGRFMAVRKIRH
jgi:hypothetical protein